MRTVKVSDGRGALYFVRPQATKFGRQDMIEISKTGPVHMDSMMGRSFTFGFAISVALSAIATAFVIDWAVTNWWPF